LVNAIKGQASRRWYADASERSAFTRSEAVLRKLQCCRRGHAFATGVPHSFDWEALLSWGAIGIGPQKEPAHSNKRRERRFFRRLSRRYPLSRLAAEG